jgi:DNA-binding NtrC family response regulator
MDLSEPSRPPRRSTERGSETVPTALLLEDDLETLKALAQWVEEAGFRTVSASTLEEARRSIESERFHLALLDLQLPDGSGLDLLEALEAEKPEPEVVFITGHASIDTAVEALRGGAIDYLTKPVDLRRLRKILIDVLKTLDLRAEISTLRHELRRLGRFGHMVGGSESMQQVYDLILRVAPTDASVLIVGETGTGKELVAQTLHELSPRAKRPFVPINCGAVPGGLIESELFGHERGSFTGADRRRKGVFEQADGGTLLLDEITEMPIDLQVKLLRVLETGSVVRVGGDQVTHVDVRVLAATNREPEKAVAEGKLRQDLLYRLLVFPIVLPPLRQREGDVALLAQHFVEGLNRRAHAAKRFSEAALERLCSHSWPGNVRELKHVIERAFILAAGDEIGADGIRIEGDAKQTLHADDGSGLRVEVGSSIREVEKRLILTTLERLKGDKKQAADVLGISLKTLYNRLNAYRAT